MINKSNKYFKDIHLDKEVLILCAGSSLKKYKSKIKSYIRNNDVVTIGINVINHLFIPDYHVWLNKKHYIKYGDCISVKSKMIFSHYMSDVIDRHYKNKDYFCAYYNKKQKDPKSLSINGEFYINGACKTAGNLSIILANIMGAKKISIAGMDGYTFHSLKKLNKGDSQHCYGVGKNDDYEWKDCVKKDEEIYCWLNSIYDYGIEFKIITPTIYKKYYGDRI